MNMFLLDISFYGLTVASSLNYQARQIEEREMPFNRQKTRCDYFMINLAQAAALSAIFVTTDIMFFRNRRLSVIAPIAPFVISLATSGLTYVVHRIGYSSQTLKAIDENLGSIMNIIGRILSVFLLIVLAPHASKFPVSFGLAGGAVALNIMDSMIK